MAQVILFVFCYVKKCTFQKGMAACKGKAQKVKKKVIAIVVSYICTWVNYQKGRPFLLRAASNAAAAAFPLLLVAAFSKGQQQHLSHKNNCDLGNFSPAIPDLTQFQTSH